MPNLCCDAIEHCNRPSQSTSHSSVYDLIVSLEDIVATKVRHHLVLPLKSYGLKAICKDPRLVNFQWTHEESGSQWSVVRYHDYLGATDDGEREQIRNEILSYNEDDVRATDAMVSWLRTLKA